MKKGRVLIAVLVILLLVIIIFWYLGKKDEAKRLEEQAIELAKYEEIIKQNNTLESLVAKSYTTASTSRLNLSNNLYLVDNLNVNQESTLSDVAIYANDIKKILLPFTATRPNEASVVLEVLKSGDFTRLEPLDSSLNMYTTALKSLLTIKIPKTAQLVHLRLVNNIQEQINLLTAMKNLKNDPVGALEAAEKYPVVASSFFKATENINIYLENRGVTFAESEQIKLFYNL